MNKTVQFILAFIIIIFPLTVEANDISKAKEVCLSIGFSSGTDKYNDCALKIYQKLKNQADTNKTIAVNRQEKKRQDHYERQRSQAERNRLAAQQLRLETLQRQQLELQRKRLQAAEGARQGAAINNLSKALMDYSRQRPAQPSFPTMGMPLNCYSSSNGYGVSTNCQ